jgi:parallel beta-helix repeat protein
VGSSEVILNNQISSNNETGIGIYYYARGGEKIQGLIANNVISNNNYGMLLLNQEETIIENNEIKSNFFGIFLSGTYDYDISSQNEIRENLFENNYCGLWLTVQAQENFVYHNNFVNNPLQAIDETPEQKNFFNKEYPIGGNFWSDHQGKDENSDGIGDTPYCFGLRFDSYIVHYGCDNYPFTKKDGWKISIPKPKILISEIYFNPDSLHGTTGTNEWENEWIELRNLDDKEIDISGWKISDNYSVVTIPNSPPIPPGGFAIITPTTSTFDFWIGIPTDTIKIVLNEKIGNGLSNENNQITLKDKEENIIDSVCYGNKGNCCKISKKEGISLEKKPFVLKQNTDFCSFFEQEKPNPGKSVLDFYWYKEIKDPKELEKEYEGYEILSAQVILGDKEILKFFPISSSKSFLNVLIASLELEKILDKGYYFREINEENFTTGGAAMKIETQKGNYLLAIDLSNSFDFPKFLLFSQDGKEWQVLEREGKDWEIYKFENNVFFVLNLDKFPVLPWKTKFISGFIFDDLKNYEILDETEEILIKENQLPIPIIEFSPKNPVKGVKVKFDASLSKDLDDEIKEFFWEIKRREEILATSTATATTFAFPENGDYQITLTVTDNDGTTSSTSTTIKVEPFSFAIITDLHIGRGCPDYDGESFDDGYNGEEYYLTQRLRNVVNWINKNKENYSLKFLAVLGDIADTAEKSEFCKAKEILDELEIPYIPIFGNHDVWPYTEKEPASTILGEDFFERIFWSATSIPCENASSTRNFETLLREFNFERGMQNPKFKNLAFNFGGIHFIGLDFNSREKEKCENCGVKGEGVVHNETISWLKNRLNQLGGKEPVIILSHEPFANPHSRWLYSEFPPLLPDKRENFDSKEIEEIQKILNEYETLFEDQQILANFGGHIHGFEKFGKEKIPISPVDLFMAGNWEYPSLSNISVVTTEALMVGTNEKDEDLNKPKYDKGILRIVRIFGSDEIDFNETAAKYNPEAGNGKEFVALNPYISWAYKFLENSSNPCIFLKSHPFTNRDISSFEWDLGDGEKRYGKVIPLYCYSAAGTYTITSTVTDAKTGWQEWITRKIEIKEGLFSKIIKIKNEFKEKTEIISQKIGENLLGFGNYLIKGKDRILLKIKHSLSIPVAELTIDFDETTGDIDLSQMIFDSNLKEKKSILYMPEWPKVVKEKILLLPK